MAFRQRCAEHPLTFLTSLGLRDTRHLSFWTPTLCEVPALLWIGETYLPMERHRAGCERRRCGEKPQTCRPRLQVTNTKTEVALGEISFCLTLLGFFKNVSQKSKSRFKAGAFEIMQPSPKVFKSAFKMIFKYKHYIGPNMWFNYQKYSIISGFKANICLI